MKFNSVCGFCYNGHLLPEGRSGSAAQAVCVIKAFREGLRNSEPPPSSSPMFLRNLSCSSSSPWQNHLYASSFASVIHLAFCLTHSSSHSVRPILYRFPPCWSRRGDRRLSLGALLPASLNHGPAVLALSPVPSLAQSLSTT